MGVVSRRVVPACGNLCVCCPSLRARSRQPVKRYKKMLKEIFPRNQEIEPNDRKIGKLCEYASRNPLRIPEITNHLEQRCYKDLRNDNFGSVRVVLCIYRKLLLSCKAQMTLFASSLLGIIQALLEQNRQDEMRILGCNSLVNVIDSQMDSTYMFNLEGLITRLCEIAQEVGDDERALRLRSAALQALASMLSFMGEHSHISMDFDKIMSVTLDNYVDHTLNKEKHGEDEQLPQPQDQSDASESLSYWSRVCLRKMAILTKEATTVRQVLEPLFHIFDAENHWSSRKGIAYSVLLYIQSVLEESDAENSHLLLSILVKHLDHKNVAKKPLARLDIINVTTKLTVNAKPKASVAIIGAIIELVKHLRKCMQNIIEVSSYGDGADKCKTDLQSALEICISKLSDKVGDVGPILDMIAGVLENISTSAVVARTTISAVFRTVQLISSLPNISYNKKPFPDGLFYQLLLAMAHPDHETRIGAHNVFSVVLMPSLLSPWSDYRKETIGATLVEGGRKEGANQIVDVDSKESTKTACPSHLSSFKSALTDGKSALTSWRLSSHQVSLLLSSIWVQATSSENTPANFEAMANTYNIALLFTCSKTSSHMALVRCFQLAFSLRRISMEQDGALHPSRRRSLFTLASCMIIFSARAGKLPEVIPIVKASLTDTVMVDPYLELVEDIRLKAVSVQSDKNKFVYGSKEDEVAALKSLSAIKVDSHQLIEATMTHFMTKFSELSEDELSSIRRELLQGFSPDDYYQIGGSLFMETPGPCSPVSQMELEVFDEIVPSNEPNDEEAFPEPSASNSDPKTSFSTNTPDVISVSQLLESVVDTARQVASYPLSSTPLPYDEVKSQCEALVTGKQEKMAVLHSFKSQREVKALVFSRELDEQDPLSYMKEESNNGDLKLTNEWQSECHGHLLACSWEYGQHTFKLPPSSPYDKFLKAAGC